MSKANWVKSWMMNFIKFVPYYLADSKCLRGWRKGDKTIHNNNKYVNIHWFFKANETAVWSWTLRSAQFPILKMWKWNWETSVKSGMGRPGPRLLFYTLISPKIKDLGFHLLSFCIHYTWKCFSFVRPQQLCDAKITQKPPGTRKSSPIVRWKLFWACFSSFAELLAKESLLSIKLHNVLLFSLWREIRLQQWLFNIILRHGSYFIF